jgi:hypothetical protein
MEGIHQKREKGREKEDAWMDGWIDGWANGKRNGMEEKKDGGNELSTFRTDTLSACIVMMARRDSTAK